MTRPASPWMTEELSLLGEQVYHFLEKEFVPHRERWDRECIIDRVAWKKAGEVGILCASIPEEYGGGGGGFAHDIVIAEQFGRHDLMGGFGSGNSVHSIVAHYILAYGTEAQKKRWLPQMAKGEMIAAVAMTEPGTGSDLQNVKTRARREGDHYVISGAKTFITNGQNADLIVVVARTGAEPGAKNISLLVLETQGAQGFTRGRNLEKIGMHSQDTSELFFDNVKVPVENLLGGVEGQGFTQLMVQLAWERLQCAFSATVAMERAVEVSTEYVKGRQAFGRAIFDFQNTQFVLAEAKTTAVISRTFVDQLLVRLLAGELDPATAAMSKWWCTDMQCKVVDQCLQLFGGYGYMTEYPIARMYADARVQKIYGGTNEIMKVIIARTL